MAQSTDDLISQVRSQLSEIVNDGESTPTTGITDNQILQALNRAQRSAGTILAKRNDSLLWTSTSVTLTAGTREYNIPAGAIERRVELVELVRGSITYELERIANTVRSAYTTTVNSIPKFYSLKKNKIELYPIPSSADTLTIHYSARPENLTTSQGQITSYSSVNGTITLDSLGADISTSVVDNAAYINIIDYTTGAVKGSAQIASINTTTKVVTIKSSGLTRSTVLGRTISTSLPSDISADDYICGVSGTCVSEFDDAYTSYLMQFAVVEMKRRNSEPVTEELQALKDLETELKGSSSGRPPSERIRVINRAWASGSRRV